MEQLIYFRKTGINSTTKTSNLTKANLESSKNPENVPKATHVNATLLLNPGNSTKADPGNIATNKNLENSTNPNPGNSTKPNLEQATNPNPGNSTKPNPGNSTKPNLEQATNPNPGNSTKPNLEQATKPNATLLNETKLVNASSPKTRINADSRRTNVLVPQIISRNHGGLHNISNPISSVLYKVYILVNPRYINTKQEFFYNVVFSTFVRSLAVEKNEFNISIAVPHISGLLIYLELKINKQFLKNYQKSYDSTMIF